MKKRKIVIATSIIGFILLAVISFSYAYITLRVLGNNKAKGVERTVASGATVLFNDLTTKNNGVISPGYTTYMKFTVQNTGNSNAKYYIYLVDVVNNFTRKQDIVYTLYRKEGENSLEEGEVSNCSNISGCYQIVSGQFPSDKTQLTYHTISGKYKTYTYILKVEYKKTTENQDEDQGHIFGGRIEISGSGVTNPFSKGTLANAIYESAESAASVSSSTRTTYSATPVTSPGNAISASSEKTLSLAQDDYGNSYYFRGKVIDNYIDFAGMCWRIVRIEGDGSIKLILEDQDNTCASSNGNWNIRSGNYGYTQYATNTLTSSDGTKNSSSIYIIDYLEGTTNNSSAMVTAFKNFQTEKLANYLFQLKSDDWCLGDIAYANSAGSPTPLTSQELLDRKVKKQNIYYDSWVRLYGKSSKEPTLKCIGTNAKKNKDNIQIYVGTLTADEIIYAGGKVQTSSVDYYLINDYHKNNSLKFWTLSYDVFSSSFYDFAFRVYNTGAVNDCNVNASNSFRPSVTLKAATKILTGDGTKSNPYKVSGYDLN